LEFKDKGKKGRNRSVN